MDPSTPDEPKLSMNVHHRTTQLNFWMVGAVILFFILGAFYISHVFHHPPVSTQEMKQGMEIGQDRWTASLG